MSETSQQNRQQPAAARPRLTTAVWLGWVVVTGVTALGFLAPLIPAFDVINNFRLWLALLATLLVVGAFLARAPRLLRPALALLLVQVGLSLLPLARAGERESGRTDSLRLLTFNLHVGNTHFDEIADYVLSSGANIVALQEVSCAAAQQLIPKLKSQYPHTFVSADNCFGLALLAKQPVTMGGQLIVAPRQRPLFVWAGFDWGGTPLTVTTVHLAPPIAPNDQAIQVQRLLNQVGNSKGPQVIAGDFNLTPFAWGFARLNNIGLGQQVSYRPTWTPTWAADWLPPLFTIDNVVTTRDLGATGVRTGPALGSDHRPVLVDLVRAKPP